MSKSHSLSRGDGGRFERRISSAEILLAVEDYWRAELRPPTVVDLMTMVGYRNRNYFLRRLRVLEKEGLLVIKKGSRGLILPGMKISFPGDGDLDCKSIINEAGSTLLTAFPAGKQRNALALLLMRSPANLVELARRVVDYIVIGLEQSEGEDDKRSR